MEEQEYREAIANEIALIGRELIRSSDSSVRITGTNLYTLALALALSDNCNYQLSEVLTNFVADQVAIIQEYYHT